MRCYVALLHKEEGGRFRIESPDFPGCAAWVDSFDEAPRVAKTVLAEELDLRLTAGEPLPSPSTPETVAGIAAQVGAVPIVVPILVPSDDRVSVELPAGLIDRVDRRARIRGVRRSDLLEKAARLALWETGRFDREPGSSTRT
jgi:predicted RNase H-like HicB family nuclease